jgi:hypothetical protein
VSVNAGDKEVVSFKIKEGIVLVLEQTASSTEAESSLA